MTLLKKITNYYKGSTSNIYLCPQCNTSNYIAHKIEEVNTYEHEFSFEDWFCDNCNYHSTGKLTEQFVRETLINWKTLESHIKECIEKYDLLVTSQLPHG